MATLLWVGLAAAATAQEDTVQQCVMTCLEGAGGGNPLSAEYESCVEDRCVAVARAGAGGEIAATWRTGETASGAPFAAVDAMADGQRITFSYVCVPDGPARIALVGYAGDDMPVRLVIDGRDYALDFTKGDSGYPEAEVAPDAAVLPAIRLGTRLAIETEAGLILAEPGLSGSNAALKAVIAECGAQ